MSVIACFTNIRADCCLQIEYVKVFETWIFPLCILTIIYRLCTLKNELNSSGYNEDFCGIWSVSKKWCFYSLNWFTTMGPSRLPHGNEKWIGCVVYSMISGSCCIMMVFGFIW